MSLSDESDWEWDSGEEDEYVTTTGPTTKNPKFIEPKTASTYRSGCWRDCAVRPRVSLPHHVVAAAPAGNARNCGRRPGRGRRRGPRLGRRVRLDSLQHALAPVRADARGRRHDLPLLSAARSPARSLRLALDPSQKERGRVLARALRDSERIGVRSARSDADDRAARPPSRRARVAALTRRRDAAATARRGLLRRDGHRPPPLPPLQHGSLFRRHGSCSKLLPIRRTGCYVIDISESRPLSALNNSTS